ncbi:MAG: zf-HC2 domain-containing protein [Deltaproteobacteria bacterium]|nr:zf-HC2 domain-containing protein [Deltaproteobacteria bacterium]
MQEQSPRAPAPVLRVDNSARDGYDRCVGCEEYQNDVEGFLSGDISDERNNAFIGHMASCEACREHLKVRRSSRAAAPRSADRPGRTIASLNPILFAGILAVLLVGAMVAMKARDTAHGLLDKHFWNVPPETAAKEQPASGDEKVEMVLARLAEELAAGPDTEAGADPEMELHAGVKCLDAGDLACAVERLRKATIAGRGTARGNEARYRLISAYARQKRCGEVMLHLAALAQDSPQDPRLGEAHLRNAECYAAEGNAGEAEHVYRMVALRFPDLREKAMAALAGLVKK